MTKELLGKNWGEATKKKQEVEQQQRDLAAARKAKEEEFVPRYFVGGFEDGRPSLSEEGQRAVEEELGRVVRV